LVSALETRVVRASLPFALPAIAAFPFALFAICATISWLYLASSYKVPFPLFVPSSSACPLALKAAAAPAMVAHEAQVLQEELAALERHWASASPAAPSAAATSAAASSTADAADRLPAATAFPFSTAAFDWACAFCRPPPLMFWTQIWRESFESRFKFKMIHSFNIAPVPLDIEKYLHFVNIFKERSR
jgi:hypothetical protein